MSTPEPTKTIWNNKDIDIPAAVAICPECGGLITVEVYETEQDDETGNWMLSELGSGVHVTCVDDDETPHYNMPYVDWLPIEPKIIKWINSHYDFNPF